MLHNLKKISDFLSRPILLFYSLFWLMVLLVIGTVAQKNMGLYEAQHLYFSSLFFWWRGIPLPGGGLTLSLITVNITAKLFLNSPWHKRRAGIILTHIGVLLLLLGSGVTYFFSAEGFIALREGQTKSIMTDYQDESLTTPLPFQVKLIDFERQVHPKTNTPRLFKSTVQLIDGDITWDSVIEMNAPLRYKGYTLYQNSFINDNGVEISVLAVVKNMGRIFPYVSSIILCLGILLHLFMVTPKLMRRKE